MRSHTLCVLAILIFSLVGCRVSKPVSSTSGVDHTVVEVWASSDCTQPGDKIKLRATVTNNGTQTEFVELIDQPVLDIIIRNQGPTVSWSDGKLLTPELTRFELKPGESKVIEMDWTVKPPAFGSVFYADASFIYSPRAPGGPAGSSVTINVAVCPGPFGP